MSFAKFGHLKGATIRPLVAGTDGSLLAQEAATFCETINALPSTGGVMNGVIISTGAGGAGLVTNYENASYPDRTESASLIAGKLSFGRTHGISEVYASMADAFGDGVTDNLRFRNTIAGGKFVFANDVNLESVLLQAGTQVVSSRKTGWSAATGTKARTAFATDSATTAQVAARLGALIDDLISHGLIGA